jgi:CubicO group peptidase (beta-lactamase class C family)
MSELKVPGVSIALIQNKDIAYSKSFGIKDSRSGSPVTDKTIFEACSMSKPVFALIVMKLLEQKLLELDKPLYDYLSEDFITNDDSHPKQITARMILSHTSGLPNWRKGEEERFGPLPLYFKPGKQFSYSGEGMFYLQRVIEKITNKKLDELSSEILFQPLGLNHTSFVWTEYIDSLLSCGHDTSGKFLAKSKYIHSNSAYTLYTTARDFAKLIIAILKTDNSENNTLSKKSVSEMLKPQVDVLVRDPIERPGRNLGFFVYWGLGWAIDSTASGKIYYHSGANRTGFRCYSQFRMDEGTGIVIMTNGLNGSDLWRRLIREIGDF